MLRLLPASNTKVYVCHFVHVQLLKDHIQKEENEDLPKLAAKYNADELKDLGARFEKAKEHLPTRCVMLCQQCYTEMSMY